MEKNYCNICGEEYNEEYNEENLVFLATGGENTRDEVLEDAVCEECLNSIKEFIDERKKIFKYTKEDEEIWTDDEDMWVENELIDEF